MRINRTPVIVLLACAACADSADPELIGRFRVTCARLSAEAEAANTSVVTGSDGWYFAAGETAALGRAAPHSAVAVDTISAHAERLRGAGVELVIAAVPPKGIIYPDRLAPELDVPIPVPRLDGTLQEAYEDLRARSVRVVDLTEAFIRDRFHPEGPLYCRHDAHWSGVGCVVAAEVIAAAVRDLAVLDMPPTRTYGLAWFTIPIQGNLVGGLAEPPRREEVRARGLIEPEDPLLTPAVRNTDAPVAIVGDTHALVFHAGEPYHARGAGIAEQLAFEFRQPVALHVEAEGVPATADWEFPVLGAGTQVAVWIFPATRLLGGG
jgi:alginate O-acetyltransferase complex protein AlgJ